MNSAEKQTVLHCLKSMIDEAVCEECPLYGTTGTDHCEKDCVRLAINALEQEPCEDAISRQAAIDLPRIKTHNQWGNVIKESVDVEGVRQLPPVTPQYTEAEIQRMQELEQAEIQKAYELGKAEMQPCEDVISKDKAIVQLSHLLSDWDDDWNVAIRKCIETIKIVPPVTPAEKVGRWKRISMDKYVQHAMAYYKCSVCGEDIIGTHNYCPSCGAKMQEVQK